MKKFEKQGIFSKNKEDKNLLGKGSKQKNINKAEKKTKKDKDYYVDYGEFILDKTPTFILEEQARLEIPGNSYLAKHSVKFYVNDIIKILLRTRTSKPLELITKYFGRVNVGLHFLGRDFNFIISTRRNLISFSLFFVHIYSDIPDKQVFSENEFYQLLILICDDFSKEYSHKIFRNIFFIFNRRPTFIELKICFYIFSFFDEFFDLILKDVYENDIKTKIKNEDSLKFFKNLNNKSINNFLNQESLKEMKLIYPCYTYIKNLISNLKETDYPQFCKLIYKDMKDKYVIAIVECMDLRCLPMTKKTILGIEKKQKEFIVKICKNNKDVENLPNNMNKIRKKMY